MQKRKTHLVDHADIPLAQMEFRLIMGDDWQYIPHLLQNIFCSCDGDDKKLVDYNAYLNDLNDIILRGKCSHCEEIASRYIETGEIPEKVVSAEQIRKLYRQMK